MAYQFQLGKLKLPDGASIDTTSGDIELGNKQVDAADLNVDDAKLSFAELIFNYSEPSNHTTDNAGEGGDLTFIIDSKHYKIQFSDASDTAGFTSGNGNGSGTAFTMNVDTVATGRDISALCDAVVTGLLNNTNGLAAKVGGSAKYNISKITTGSNANKEVSIRSLKAGATYDFGSVSKGSISSMNAPSVLAYAAVNLFNMSTDDVFATKTAAEVAAALPIMSSNNPSFTGTLTVGLAELSEAELEILDGATVTTAELNILDGVTATAAELNILDGVTSTAAELNILDGVTATASELNILDGVTATASELNIMDGVTASTAELNYVDGVTSNIQTQLNAKVLITDTSAESGANKILKCDGNGDFEMQDSDKIFFGDDAHGGSIFFDGSDVKLFSDVSGLNVDIGHSTSNVRVGQHLTVAGDLTVTGKTITNNVEVVSTTTGIQFEGSAVDAADAILKSVVAGSNKTYTLPNITGFVPILSNDPGTTAITSTAAELNILDGVTASTSELNILDGVTSTAAELNILDGVTASTSELNIMDGVTATTAELNILDGVTATAAELNAIDKSRKFQALTTSTTIAPGSGHIVILVPTDASQTFTLPEITSSLEGMVLRIKNAHTSNLTTLAKHGNNPANCLEGANSVVLDPGSAISCIAIDTGTNAFEWVIM